MRHALAEALQDYDGALVLVSHDRHLLRVCCDELLLVNAGRVEPFDGSLDDYPAWLAARQQGEPGASDKTAAAAGSAAAKKEQRRREAEARARLQPLRKRLADLERDLETLTARRDRLEQDLANPDLYDPSAKSRLLKLMDDKQQVDAALAAVELDWLTIGEDLERQQRELGA
jgi:ATP-binding cassette subfamily F protein 3